MKVIRILVYETATPEQMSNQLEASLKDFVPQSIPGGTVTVVTVRPAALEAVEKETPILTDEIYRALDWRYPLA